MVQVLPRIGTRQALLGSVAALVVLGLLAWWLLPREEPPSGTITFSTGADRGVYQQYGKQLRTAIAEDMPDLRVGCNPATAPSRTSTAWPRARPTSPSPRPTPCRRTSRRAGPAPRRCAGVARLYDDYVQLVVPADSTIQNIVGD